MVTLARTVGPHMSHFRSPYSGCNPFALPASETLWSLSCQGHVTANSDKERSGGDREGRDSSQHLLMEGLRKGTHKRPQDRRRL